MCNFRYYFTSSVIKENCPVFEHLWSITYPHCSRLMLYDLHCLSNVAHYSFFYTDMSAFFPLLITGHGSHNLTPITPTTHHPGKELRKDLIYFYTHVYIAEMEAIAKQFEPLPGVSRCVQNSGGSHFDFVLWIF